MLKEPYNSALLVFKIFKRRLKKVSWRSLNAVSHSIFLAFVARMYELVAGTIPSVTYYFILAVHENLSHPNNRILGTVQMLNFSGTKSNVN